MPPGPSEAVWHGGGRRTKNLQGEGEKEEKGGKKEKRGERKEEKRERNGEESKREICITPIKTSGTPLELSKDYKTRKEGGLKKAKNKQTNKKAGREEEETEKAGENMVTEDRLICENQGFVFYSSIKPFLS